MEKLAALVKPIKFQQISELGQLKLMTKDKSSTLHHFFVVQDSKEIIKNSSKLVDQELFHGAEVIFGSKGKSFVKLEIGEEFLNLRIIGLSK